jgi:prolyl 4-hydroxylase
VKSSVPTMWFLVSVCVVAIVLASSGLEAALWPGTRAVDAGIDLYPEEYGVDNSFPIHHYQTRNNIHKARYEQSMAGCYKQASRSLCDGTERARMEMNRDQPATQHNYTEIGFKKMRVPEELFKNILAFYTENKDKEKVESWPAGNTYVNHWEVPSMMIRCGN